MQAVHTNRPSNPLCDFPFSVDGFENLELKCADSDAERPSQVTAIATNGKQTHNCTELPLSIYPTSCGAGVAVWQRFACQ